MDRNKTKFKKHKCIPANKKRQRRRRPTTRRINDNVNNEDKQKQKKKQKNKNTKKRTEEEEDEEGEEICFILKTRIYLDDDYKHKSEAESSADKSRQPKSKEQIIEDIKEIVEPKHQHASSSFSCMVLLKETLIKN